MSDDPGRDLIMWARDQGLFTAAEAESLDAWAGELAHKMARGELTEAAFQRELRARLEADIARRGRA